MVLRKESHEPQTPFTYSEKMSCWTKYFDRLLFLIDFEGLVVGIRKFRQSLNDSYDDHTQERWQVFSETLCLFRIQSTVLLKALVFDLAWLFLRPN